jgi:hypothetical protein
MWLSGCLGSVLFVLSWLSPEASFQQAAALQFSGGLFLFFLLELFMPQMAASLFDRGTKNREWVDTVVAPKLGHVPLDLLLDCLQKCMKSYGVDARTRRECSEHVSAAISDSELDDGEKRRVILFMALEQAGRYGVRYVVRTSNARLKVQSR